MKAFLIGIAILFAGGMIASAIQESNLPESVKIQKYELEKFEAKQAELKELALKEAAAAKAKETEALLESLSDMSWSEIYELPSDKKHDVLFHYGSKFVFFIIVISGLIALLGAFERAARGR